MKTAKLETLGLEVPLKKLWEYYSHGYVKDIERWFFETFGPQDIKYQDLFGIKECFECGGAFLRIKGKKPSIKKEVHVICRNMEDTLANLLVYGHEETHALQYLEGLNILEKSLKEEYNLSLKLKKLDGELRADVGGVYGLLKKGVSLEDIRKIDPSLINYRRLQKAADFFENVTGV